jgi:hypothetical protein
MNKIFRKKTYLFLFFISFIFLVKNFSKDSLDEKPKKILDNPLTPEKFDQLMESMKEDLEYFELLAKSSKLSEIGLIFLQEFIRGYEEYLNKLQKIKNNSECYLNDETTYAKKVGEEFQALAEEYRNS